MSNRILASPAPSESPAIVPLSRKPVGPSDALIRVGRLIAGDQQYFAKYSESAENHNEANELLILEAGFLESRNNPSLMGEPTRKMIENRVVLTWPFAEGISLFDLLNLLRANESLCSVSQRTVIIQGLIELMRDVHANQDGSPYWYLLLSTRALENTWLTRSGELKSVGIAEIAGEKIIQQPESWTVLKAPELVIEGHAIDNRADIYAAGALMFHILTLRPVISDTQLNERVVYRMFRNVNPRPSDVFDQLAKYDPIIEKSLQWLPENRYHCAQDMLDALFSVTGDSTSDQRTKLKHLYDLAFNLSNEPEGNQPTGFKDKNAAAIAKDSTLV